MSAKKIMSFFIMLLLFIDCRSKSAQANLRSKNAEKNSSITTKTKKILLYPTSTTNQVITHSYLTLSYSEKDEQAEWVFYKVSNKNYNKHVKRTNDYREDPFVKTESASPNDYKGSGYDMGHLAPAHAMAHNYKSMSESFYLSNISPQKASFNRGIWKSLESKVEYWSSFRDSIYVVTGPILDSPIDQIGANQVNVPRAFYKTLVSFKDGKTNGIAFILPNEKSSKSIYAYATSIDEVEKITNIDFYCNLEKSIQDRVENNSDIKKWITRK